MESLFTLTVVLFFYFIPAIVAKANDSDKTGAVFVLNLFLGWTFIGWVVSLVLAVWPSKK